MSSTRASGRGRVDGGELSQRGGARERCLLKHAVNRPRDGARQARFTAAADSSARCCLRAATSGVAADSWQAEPVASGPRAGYRRNVRAHSFLLLLTGERAGGESTRWVAAGPRRDRSSELTAVDECLSEAAAGNRARRSDEGDGAVNGGAGEHRSEGAMSGRGREGGGGAGNRGAGDGAGEHRGEGATSCCRRGGARNRGAGGDAGEHRREGPTSCGEGGGAGNRAAGRDAGKHGDDGSTSGRGRQGRGGARNRGAGRVAGTHGEADRRAAIVMEIAARVDSARTGPRAVAVATGATVRGIEAPPSRRGRGGAGNRGRRRSAERKSGGDLARASGRLRGGSRSSERASPAVGADDPSLRARRRRQIDPRLAARSATTAAVSRGGRTSVSAAVSGVVTDRPRLLPGAPRSLTGRSAAGRRRGRARADRLSARGGGVA